jgi:hypothetical protein
MKDRKQSMTRWVGIGIRGVAGRDGVDDAAGGEQEAGGADEAAADTIVVEIHKKRFSANCCFDFSAIFLCT